MADSSQHEIDSGVVADWVDERDADYEPDTDGALPAEVGYDVYKHYVRETWHQRGEECTGFALAAIANYLIRKRKNDPSEPAVSRRMLYEMAQRYDGAAHVTGSTLRGALKGWSRVGVAQDTAWPYAPGDESGAVHGSLSLARVLDGSTRPLTRYRRIKGEDVATMKRAVAEGHALYVAAQTHVGWYRLFLRNSEPVIQRRHDDVPRGIHAFVIVGYNDDGFWLHNSWGPEWGDEGYALLPYDQWTWGATDAWVVDAGIDPPRPATRPVPVVTDPEPSSAEATAAYRDMWQHLVVLSDDGQLASRGPYEMDEGSVKTMLYLFDEHMRTEQWANRKLAVIADGGYFSTAVTIERLRPLRDRLLAQQIYPIFLIWETAWYADMVADLQTWLQVEMDAHDQGDPVTMAKCAAARSGLHSAWAEVRRRSVRACAVDKHEIDGGAQLLANWIAYKRRQNSFDLHLVSHGAGDLLMAQLAVQLPTPITTAASLGSALPVHRFDATYGEMLADGCLQDLTRVSLEPQAEENDAIPGTSVSALTVIADVLAQDGASVRKAAREIARQQPWPLASLPLVGRPGAASSGPSGREITVSESGHLDMLVKPEIHELLVTNMEALTRPPSGPHEYPTDPLALAQQYPELFRSTASSAEHVAAPQPSRDPLVRAQAIVDSPGESTIRY